MGSIVSKLKEMQPVSPVKFDEALNNAVRANNADICGREEDAPADGGNIAKLKEQSGNSKDPKAAETSLYNYKGASAEELVALLLYKDFEAKAARDAAKKDAPSEEQANEAVNSDTQIALCESAICD